MMTFNSLQDDLMICQYSQHHKVKRGLTTACPLSRMGIASVICSDITKLLCTETTADPPYEVPVPEGAQPFHHEPEEQWVCRASTVPHSGWLYIASHWSLLWGSHWLQTCQAEAVLPVTECERPPSSARDSKYPQLLTVPAFCNMRRLGKADCGVDDRHWDQALKLESKAVRQPDFGPIRIEQPHNQQAPEAQSHLCSVQADSGAHETFKKDCGFNIYIAANKDGSHLEVRSLNLEHNHAVVPELFKHPPQQRRLPSELQDKARALLNLKANKILVRQEMQKESRNAVLLKDFSNISAKGKKCPTKE
ncbi:hypothetical protein MRX96_028304 [Rhipicephalus microplus]